MKPTPPTLKTIEKPAERLGVALYGEEQPATDGEVKALVDILARMIERLSKEQNDEASSSVHTSLD